ncbi:hypothetical protein ACFFX0_04935 [Citricoccus parietis]|uniref:Uncharacterized protein n=1 Tax=Citricoccus parietis TaxID=592307 RepID=A0ABV5FV59_9MICC
MLTVQADERSTGGHQSPSRPSQGQCRSIRPLVVGSTQGGSYSKASSP